MLSSIGLLHAMIFSLSIYPCCIRQWQSQRSELTAVRSAGICGSPDTRPGKCLQLLPSQQGVLECVLQTISRGWMCILVGGAAVGKTSLARTAAQVAGQQLTEIALTGGTDTADLLGGFEQLEPKRKVQVGRGPVLL